MIFNNNYTGIHVIDAIEGVYVGNDNAAEDTNEQGDQKGTVLPIEFSKYIQLIKLKMTHKVNLQLSEFSKTRGSPRNPCHG